MPNAVPAQTTIDVLVQRELPRSDRAAADARRFVEEHARDRVSDSAIGRAKMVVSELATNAVVHGDGRITLKLQLEDDSLRIEVIDEGTRNVPAIRASARDDAPGGWGLQIVERLSDRWGVSEGSTHVWADIPR